MKFYQTPELIQICLSKEDIMTLSDIENVGSVVDWGDGAKTAQGYEE